MIKITKKKIEYIFLGIALAALSIIIIKSIIAWMEEKSEEKNLLKWLGVSVAKVEATLPPGLIIEVFNKGTRTIGRTHFRLIFTIEDKILCSVNADIGNFKPQKKRTISLRCSQTDSSARYELGRTDRVSYKLFVFPEWKKQLKPIKGEFKLKY